MNLIQMNMGNTGHRQVMTKYGIKVDELLVPILEDVWDSNIETYASCQGYEKKPKSLRLGTSLLYIAVTNRQRVWKVAEILHDHFSYLEYFDLRLIIDGHVGHPDDRRAAVRLNRGRMRNLINWNPEGWA